MVPLTDDIGFITALSVSSGGGNTYAINLIRELGRDPRGFRFTVLGAHGRFPADAADGLDVAIVRLPLGTAQALPLLRMAYEETLLAWRTYEQVLHTRAPVPASPAPDF